MFDVFPAFSSEGTAHVPGHNPEVMSRLSKDTTCQNVPHPMRILNVGIKGISALSGVIVAYCPAWLHILSMDTRHDVSPSCDMPRCFERTVRLRPISNLELVRNIVGTFIPNGRCG